MHITIRRERSEREIVGNRFHSVKQRRMQRTADCSHARSSPWPLPPLPLSLYSILRCGRLIQDTTVERSDKRLRRKDMSTFFLSS